MADIKRVQVSSGSVYLAECWKYHRWPRLKDLADTISEELIDQMTDTSLPKNELPGTFDYWDFVSLATRNLNRQFRPTEVSASHLALNLNRASETITQVSESHVHRPRKLSWSAFRMLFVLWNVGEIEQSRLTVLTNSSKATVSNLVASLLKQGLVSRSNSPTDRRTFLVQLTEEGVSVVEELYLEQNQLFVQWASVLSQDEIDTLQRLISKLMRRRDIFGVLEST